MRLRRIGVAAAVCLAAIVVAKEKRHCPSADEADLGDLTEQLALAALVVGEVCVLPSVASCPSIFSGGGIHHHALSDSRHTIGYGDWTRRPGAIYSGRFSLASSTPASRVGAMPCSSSPTPCYAPGRVSSFPSLSLEPVFSRSHGSLYKALARGRIDEERCVTCSSSSSTDRVADALRGRRIDLRPLRCRVQPRTGLLLLGLQTLGRPADRGRLALPVDLPARLGARQLDCTGRRDADPPSGQTLRRRTVDQIRRLVGLLPEDGEVPLFVSTPAMTPSPRIGTTHRFPREVLTVSATTASSMAIHHHVRTAPETGGRPPRHGRRCKCPTR